MVGEISELAGNFVFNVGTNTPALGQGLVGDFDNRRRKRPVRRPGAAARCNVPAHLLDGLAPRPSPATSPLAAAILR